MSRILLCQSSESETTELDVALSKKGYDVVLSLDLDALADLEDIQGFEPYDLSTVHLALIDVTCGSDGITYLEACHRLFPFKPRILLVDKDASVDAECQKLTCGNVLQMPFTPRRVLNRVAKLLNHREGNILRVGGLTLNLQTRCVHRGEIVYRLTPKQADLLQVLMEREGQTLTRKFLMAAVWNTDYMGDTRTLDVHIRWLREKIEENPSHPRYLRTVRGVGYRLGVPAEE